MTATRIRIVLVLGGLVAAGLAYFVLAPSPEERLAAAIDARQWAEVESLASEILAASPDGGDADLYRNLGLARGRLGEHAQALEAFRAARALVPDDDDLRRREAVEIVRVGEVYEDEAQPGPALALYRQALELAPEVPDSHRAVVRVLGAQGEMDATIEALEGAARWIPQDVMLKLELAWRLASHPDPAKRDGKRALLLAGDALMHDRTPRTLDVYAVALAAQARFHEAIGYELDAIELAGGEGAPLFEERRRRVGQFTRQEPYVEGRLSEE